MQIHDYEERRWRHLDSCQFQTIIVSRVPSVRCPEHGSQTVAVPWAEKYTRFTRLFVSGGANVTQN
jgi:transposase